MQRSKRGWTRARLRVDVTGQHDLEGADVHGGWHGEEAVVHDPKAPLGGSCTNMYIMCSLPVLVLFFIALWSHFSPCLAQKKKM